MPAKPHFFQPLLPGFQDRFFIPVSFFKYLKGHECHKLTLRSRDGKLWPIKINGRQFSDGWKQFVQDHDLHIGDVIVFRHEGDLAFDFVVFDKSTCEREYPSNVHIKEEETEYPPFIPIKEEEIEIRCENVPIYTSSGKKVGRKKKPNWFGAKASSSVLKHDYPNCVIKLTQGNIKKCRLYIPQEFARENGLYGRSCSIILKDEESHCWRAKLTYTKLDKKFVIGAGWSDFQNAHKLKEGDSIILELIKNEEMPVIRICKVEEHSNFTRPNTEAYKLMKSQQKNPEVTKESGSGNKVERRKKPKTISELKDDSCVLEKPYPSCVIKLSPDNIKKCRLPMPRKFARENGLYSRSCTIILRDEDANCWRARLLYTKLDKKFVIGTGWSIFRDAHKLKEGDSVMVELIKNGGMPIIQIRRLQEHVDVTWEPTYQHNVQPGFSPPGVLHVNPEAFDLAEALT